MKICLNMLNIGINIHEVSSKKVKFFKISEGREISLPYEMTSRFIPEIFVKSSSPLYRTVRRETGSTRMTSQLPSGPSNRWGCKGAQPKVINRCSLFSFVNSLLVVVL